MCNSMCTMITCTVGILVFMCTHVCLHTCRHVYSSLIDMPHTRCQPGHAPHPGLAICPGLHQRPHGLVHQGETPPTRTEQSRTTTRNQHKRNQTQQQGEAPPRLSLPQRCACKGGPHACNVFDHYLFGTCKAACVIHVFWLSSVCMYM